MVTVRENLESQSDEDIVTKCDSPNLLKPSADVVVNVEFFEKNKTNFMRFDVMTISGDDGRYYSILYDLSTRNGTNGLFDFIDDYYSNRFCFFPSSKSIQALCIALHEQEERFYKNTGFNFKDYGDSVVQVSVEKTTRADIPIAKCKISDGYSIGCEAYRIYKEKHSAIGGNGHIEKIGSSLKKFFDKALKKFSDTKFCCVGITNTPKIPQSFVMDPIVGLPLIIYDENYVSMLLKSCFRGSFNSDTFKVAGIDKIIVDLWGIGEDLDVDGLMKIVGIDGELKVNYDKETFDDLDIFLGKFKTIHFGKNSYNESDNHQTVIKPFI